MPLRLNETQISAIRAHGEETYPYECCGFLVGDVDGDDAIVHEVIRASNTRDDSPNNRYAIDPKELHEIDMAAGKRKLGVVGIYHSHPDVAAQPSEFDREHACPWYCYAIVSIVKGEAKELRNWKLVDDGSRFYEDRIVNMDERDIQD
jgi:proteasome lid subunit RPN8/RPN11